MQTLWFIAIVPSRKIIEKVEIHRQYAAEHFSTRHALKTVPHITLFPPFRQSDAVGENLGIFLKEFFRFYKPLTLSIRDFGAFKPRVIFLDIERNKSLGEMWGALNHLMVDQFRLVQKREKRKFRPHLTIAHRDLDREFFPKAWNHFKDQEFREDFEANRVVLFRHDSKYWQEYGVFSIDD